MAGSKKKNFGGTSIYKKVLLAVIAKVEMAHSFSFGMDMTVTRNKICPTVSNVQVPLCLNNFKVKYGFNN